MMILCTLPNTLHRYPGSTFMDHVIRYQDTPGIKMIVVLGEVGLNVVESCFFLYFEIFVCVHLFFWN